MTGFKTARQPDKGMSVLEKKDFEHYGFKNPAGVLRETNKYGVDFRNVFDQTPLMIASRMGNADLTEALLDRDADTSLVDGNGLNAFQISLERACADERFARTKLPAVFERLAPASLDLQIDGRLVKLDRRLMEYLMLCIAMVLFYQRLGENYASCGRLLSAVDFAEVFGHFPESVVPARRKKRAYISSILSKNEVSWQGLYNRKLFLRVSHGQYLINPQLAVRVEDDWRRIYELLCSDRLAGKLRDPLHWAGQVWDLNADRERAIVALRTMFKDLNDGRGVPVFF